VGGKRRLIPDRSILSGLQRRTRNGEGKQRGKMSEKDVFLKTFQEELRHAEERNTVLRSSRSLLITHGEKNLSA